MKYIINKNEYITDVILKALILNAEAIRMYKKINDGKPVIIGGILTLKKEIKTINKNPTTTYKENETRPISKAIRLVKAKNNRAMTKDN
ncbi:hypothetical protein OZ410_04040 [Robiginitalea sp. M366]|uniref:hypothetical protein n=1 Tax=Robiginitalea aestuariiviva TaxID=3036903 RepID=UPI00240DFBF6|nr:hypothetical protein [Robiginitalea aestuariiviva]MDG1571473.1 hypothetical protein [Robiginitalea aestuariiviva]